MANTARSDEHAYGMPLPGSCMATAAVATATGLLEPRRGLKASRDRHKSQWVTEAWIAGYGAAGSPAIGMAGAEAPDTEATRGCSTRDSLDRS